ncbi:MAG: AAA domain-containing protein [Rhizomicrobium sp.]
MDADSSQAVAIAEAAGGRTLVVKGPPGTGKSQTITNIIAAAVARGKKVLFVAEKMAALDVVYRRLKNADLGAIALELHSSKANKRSVLEELRRTEALVPRPVRGEAATIESLGVARNVLNDHANRLHAPLPPHAFTAYQILGHLLRTEQPTKTATRWPLQRHGRPPNGRNARTRFAI